MHATVYSFDQAVSRKRGGDASPIDARAEVPFASQLERLLERLGGFRLRISLAWLPGGQAVVEQLQDPCALVGAMPDGSIVAAFLGPRGGDSTAGDAEMTARIRRRFEQALRAMKTDDGTEPLDALRIAHCWSDEVVDVPQLILDRLSEREATAVPGDSPAVRLPA
jgi:AcrR family transcriptional regulator